MVVEQHQQVVWVHHHRFSSFWKCQSTSFSRQLEISGLLYHLRHGAISQLTEVSILQGIYPLKDEWVFGCSLKTRLADQTKTQQLKWLWSNDTKDSTINQRLVEQTQEETLSWKVVEVLPWMTP